MLNTYYTPISGSRAQQSESEHASKKLLALNVVYMTTVKDPIIGDLERITAHFWQEIIEERFQTEI